MLRRGSPLAAARDWTKLDSLRCMNKEAGRLARSSYVWRCESRIAASGSLVIQPLPQSPRSLRFGNADTRRR
jgi:hypothetical protein